MPILLFVGIFIACVIITVTHTIAYAITCMIIVTKGIAYDEFLYRQVLELTFMFVIILETCYMLIVKEQQNEKIR